MVKYESKLCLWDVIITGGGGGGKRFSFVNRKIYEIFECLNGYTFLTLIVRGISLKICRHILLPLFALREKELIKRAYFEITLINN